MVWEGDGQYALAESLKVLFQQLRAGYPDNDSDPWFTNNGTGTIGDAAHRAEGSASDHNPWLNNTVRALDIAVSSGGPDCEALFQMVNRMYGAQDPRVFPNGYAVFNYRITSWSDPGGFHAQDGDPHTGHLHISVSQNPSGYNSSNPWPIGSGVTQSGGAEMDAAETAMLQDVHDRLKKIDTMAFNVDGGAGVESLRAVVGKMRQDIQALTAAVAALKPPAA